MSRSRAPYALALSAVFWVLPVRCSSPGFEVWPSSMEESLPFSSVMLSSEAASVPGTRKKEGPSLLDGFKGKLQEMFAATSIATRSIGGIGEIGGSFQKKRKKASDNWFGEIENDGREQRVAKVVNSKKIEPIKTDSKLDKIGWFDDSPTDKKAQKKSERKASKPQMPQTARPAIPEGWFEGGPPDVDMPDLPGVWFADSPKGSRPATSGAKKAEAAPKPKPSPSTKQPDSQKPTPIVSENWFSPAGMNQKLPITKPVVTRPEYVSSTKASKTRGAGTKPVERMKPVSQTRRQEAKKSEAKGGLPLLKQTEKDGGRAAKEIGQEMALPRVSFKGIGAGLALKCQDFTTHMHTLCAQTRVLYHKGSENLTAKSFTPTEWVNQVKAALAVSVCALGARQYGALWVAESAGAKFASRPGLYLTIPAIAGVLNWATNQLAVWMIFNPEVFVGIPLIRKEAQPLGLFGWQGIVPSKVRKMGGDIVDMTINELLDVKECFKALQPGRVASIMSQDAAEETQTLSRGMIYEARNRVEGGDTTLVGRAIAGKAQRVVKRVVGRVRKDPLKYCALKKSVVEDMAARRRTICELFQRCGKDELKFIVDVGLVGGAALGFAQMGAWLVYSPKWSLIAGGALVGYVTDWIALKVMFEPVQPWRPKWAQGQMQRITGKEWPGFQGLFLTRQVKEFLHVKEQER